MSQKLQPARGTKDLFGEDYRKIEQVLTIAQNLATCYGYEPITTPIFESTAVFKRPLGETSDVVGKEMYTFTDRGGEEVTLRPEGTAGVVRAVISNGMTQNMPLKLSYFGPMFRYERPQQGRYRQFHQMGVECFGINHPLVDAETIALGYEIIKSLGLENRIEVQINTIGDIPSRQAFRQALVDYFTPLKNQLSEDSQSRLSRNPLRILDSKDAKDQEIVKEAPRFEDYLNDDSVRFFEQVCRGLEALNIPYKINRHLVRGLDYYTHTAFEFVTTDLGAQGTVLAGGRYDGLVQQMGGPETAGVGWALGADRLALMLQAPENQVKPVALIPLGETENVAFTTGVQLRNLGFVVDFLYNGNMGKRMKRANKVTAVAAIIIGEEELQTGQVIVKNMESGSQELVKLSGLAEYLTLHFPNTRIKVG
ncbi:histidine--tRNA ligase [Candidatus Paracaedibacter symbiosus]|uniref:histidine--tRNA ligase n=1 Tax=Candidatus Paracaedibacter symbiosus TaxID=244582 RepID=UPI00050950AF|nr:histidine--tRNA ligase [Candidatus Paracaedibacter symbiosus]